MSWVTDKFQHRFGSKKNERPYQTVPESPVELLAYRKWTELIDGLRLDAEEFRRLGGQVDLKQISDLQFRLSHRLAGLAVTINADISASFIQYDFAAAEKGIATPEGGFFSLRISADKGMNLYSADEQLTHEQARRIILEPLLFPIEPAQSVPIGKVETRS